MGLLDRERLLNAAFFSIAFAVLVFALYPGRFDGDSIGQYRQGLAFHFEDSHSVMNAGLLGILADIAKGPGPMFVLQLLLWIGGLLLFTDALIASGRRVEGAVAAVLSLIPLLSFDYLDIQKDALLTALVAMLVGLGTRRLLGLPTISQSSVSVQAVSIPWLVACFCLLVLALDTRQNAFFALIPLWFLFWPVRQIRLRAVLPSVVAGALVFSLAMGTIRWVDDDILHTEHRHLINALIIFDLAGISARTGQDASQGLLPDFSANVAKCYNSNHWDEFLGGECRAVGQAAAQLVQDKHSRAALMRRWIGQIVRHPVAYAEHRLRNFQCLLRAGCTNIGGGNMSPGLGKRPWDDPDTRITKLALVLQTIEESLSQGPLGHGVLWLCLLLAELGIAGSALRRRGFAITPYLAFVLATAAITYTAGFLVVGVADEFRYLHPIISLAIIAAPLAIGVLPAACLPARSPV